MIIPNWHPIFVNFTVALSSVALLFMLMSRFTPKQELRVQWRHSARWTLWLGALFTLFTILSGFHAFSSVTIDQDSYQAALLHRNWALVGASLFFLMVFWSISCCRRGRIAGYGFLVAMLLLVVVVNVTAWLGAELVFRHGLGVMSLPGTEQVKPANEIIE